MKEKLCLELQILREKSTVFLMAIFAVAVSIAGTLGNKIDVANKSMYTPNLKDFLWIGISSVIFFAFFIFVLILLRKYSGAEEKESFSAKRWGLRAIALFICWIPYFLMFYPGSLSSDSYVTVNQVLGNYPLHNHHPIMFTMFVKLCMNIGMKFGGIETGIAFYSIVQMMIMSLAVSGIMEWLKIKALPKVFMVITFIFYAFDGLMAIYSFTMWKDVLFSVWIVLLSIYLYELTNFEQEQIVKKKQWGILTILCLLVAFGRNNGLYVVVMVMAGLLITNRKVWKQIAVRAVVLVAAIMIIQGPVYTKLGIGKGNFAESLAVPLQQMAYTVYHDGKIGEEEAEFLERLIPLETMKELYNPLSADPIKFSEEFDNKFLEKNKGEFLKTWAKILPDNLGMYIKAYCMHTWGYWDVDVANWRGWYGAPDIDQFVKIDGTDYVEKVIGIDLKNAVSSLYEMKVNQIPVVKYLYSIAFSFWFAVFCLIVLIVQKQSRKSLALIPLSGVWLTLMVAAPVFCEFRYMFAFHVALPVILGMILLAVRRKEEK